MTYPNINMNKNTCMYIYVHMYMVGSGRLQDSSGVVLVIVQQVGFVGVVIKSVLQGW